MEIFFLWVVATVIILAGYLCFLWWRPHAAWKKERSLASPTRIKNFHKKSKGRFQVRLAILLLLFALVPAVPLIFLASSLYTRSMEILLVPQIESSLLKSIEVIKLQLEDRARLFESATRDHVITPELLRQWQMEFCLLWRQEGTTPRCVLAVGSEERSRQYGLGFSADRITEIWGQAGSELESVTSAGPEGAATYCCVWLPRTYLSNETPEQPRGEMLIIGFLVDPNLVMAKRDITEAARVYNSLALLKERMIHDKILWSAAALFIVLLSVFSVWAARRFSHSLSKPIEMLTATMADVAAGNLNVQIKTTARDELGVLIDSFNQMIEDLRLSREKLIASERLAAWRDVARQVSHEIKNPLSSIQLAIYRLRQRFAVASDGKETSMDAIRESFQSLDEELAGLRHLAEAFSEFARFPQADLKPANLNEVVQLTARLHEASGPERIKIQLDLDPDLPLCLIDREQIKRLLNNLLKNALEAQPHQRCEVSITTRRQENRVILEIRDNGPGLPPEVRAHIFEPNFTTKRQGTGLGLVMVKRIVEEHGGTIAIESEPGKGTCFRVVI